MSEETVKSMILKAIQAIKEQPARQPFGASMNWCLKCGAWPIYVYEKLRPDIEAKGKKETCGCYTFLHSDYGLQTYKIVFLKKLPNVAQEIDKKAKAPFSQKNKTNRRKSSRQR